MGHERKPRRHGTRAAYVFGVEPGRGAGCRCALCRTANREYQRRRDRSVRRPDETPEAAFVDATEVREHLRWLAGEGVGLRTVAGRAKVSRSALAKIKSGERSRCTPGLAERVLAIGLHRAAPGCRVDAKQTWRLLDDMLANGHTRTGIAKMLGSKAKTPALQIKRERVTVKQARKVEDLYHNVMHEVIARRERERDEQRVRRAERREPTREGGKEGGNSEA